jgi:hypothetical protein
MRPAVPRPPHAAPGARPCSGHPRRGSACESGIPAAARSGSGCRRRAAGRDGRGGETTTIGFGPDYNDKHITSWFIHRFINNVSSISSVSMRVLRDDGIVVFLNGNEIFRDNLPGGEITPETLALAEIPDEDKDLWLGVTVPTNALSSTIYNLLAAEVHLAAPDSLDKAFDLHFQIAGNRRPDLAVTSPPLGSVRPPGTPVWVSAEASDPFGEVAEVQFTVFGDPIGEFTSPPYEFEWMPPGPGYYLITATATDNLGATTFVPPRGVWVRSRPLVAIERISPTQLLISWPDELQGFRAPRASLQTTTNLTPPVQWHTLATQYPGGAGVYEFIVETESDERYFRVLLE